MHRYSYYVKNLPWIGDCAIAFLFIVRVTGQSLRSIQSLWSSGETYALLFTITKYTTYL